MLIAAYVLCGLMCPLIVFTVFFDRKKHMVMKTVFKGLTSLCFVLAGVLCYVSGSLKCWETLVLIGLALGMVGDVLLSEFASGKMKDADNAAGMLAFIAGHVLYISAFIVYADEFNFYTLIAPAAMLVLVAVGFGTKTLGVDKPFMAAGAFIYAAVVSTTLAAAINLFWALGERKTTLLILLGVILFTVSDCLLALMNYNKKLNRKTLFPYVLAAYYAGQALIAVSLAY